jgi:hypothetical protein
MDLHKKMNLLHHKKRDECRLHEFDNRRKQVGVRLYASQASANARKVIDNVV